MTVLTASGLFVHGTPIQIVGRLRDLVTAGAPLVGGVENASSLLAECERVDRYQRVIGPAMAEVAATNLLRALEEDGLLLTSAAA